MVSHRPTDLPSHVEFNGCRTSAKCDSRTRLYSAVLSQIRLDSAGLGQSQETRLDSTDFVRLGHADLALTRRSDSVGICPELVEVGCTRLYSALVGRTWFYIFRWVVLTDFAAISRCKRWTATREVRNACKKRANF